MLSRPELFKLKKGRRIERQKYLNGIVKDFINKNPNLDKLKALGLLQKKLQ
jgi:hypothetical protein